MAKNVPISSVYGDTGTVEATFTKDLNSIGNDPYVQVTANSGEFNLFQQMNLSDNFYDSRYEEVYVTQNSAGSGGALSLASLQFNTMGWVRADKMFLQIPVVINRVASNSWHGYNTDPQVASHLSSYPDPTLTFWQQAIMGLTSPGAANLTIGTAVRSENITSNMTQGDLSLMHIFNRIGIYAGNNNQPIGRTQSFFTEGLKTQMREVPWNANTIKILSQWGLPVSNLTITGTESDAAAGTGFRNADYGANQGLIDSFSPDGNLNPMIDEIPIAWRLGWAKVLNSTDPMLCGGEYKILDEDKKNSVYNQTILNLVLPLSYINNFFRHKTYIPPDFKFKIDIEGVMQNNGDAVNFNCPLIAVNGLNEQMIRMKISATQMPVVSAFTAGINFSNIKLVYQQHTLRQPIQAQINEKWLSYPIVYNYETFETYDIDNSTTGNSTQIVRDIAISQQRPTQLILQIIDTVSQTQNITGDIAGATQYQAFAFNSPPLQYPFQLNPLSNSSVGTSGTHGTATKGSTPYFCDRTVRDLPICRIGALSTKSNIKKAPTPGLPAQAYSFDYPMVTSMSVLIGGRTQYYYKNDTFTHYNVGNLFMNAYDVLIAEQDAENYKDYSTETNVLKTPLEYIPFGGLGAFLRITIAPGGYVNTADLPTDLGASVIRVVINLSNPLPATKKLQIVKKNPEQIAVDTNKNCTLIMWPAIKSNNGFTIPNVVNTQ